MSSKHSRGGEVGSETPKARRTAWAGRAVLALVPLVVLGTTARQVLRQQDEEMLRHRAEQQWRRFAEELGRAESLPRTRRSVDDLVDEAFAPVYAGDSRVSWTGTTRSSDSTKSWAWRCSEDWEARLSRGYSASWRRGSALPETVSGK